MKYISTRGQSEPVDFIGACLAGLAPDGGLYIPESYPAIAPAKPGEPYSQVAARVISAFAGDTLTQEEVLGLCERAYATFAHQSVTPLTQSGPSSWLLELHHGPTLAFKDVAMQLIGQLYDLVLGKTGRRMTIMCATSGDTGGAVANGFYNVEGVNVVILYPSGKVSHIQEQQLTTLGGNIEAIEVDGTFDDCQAMVKQAFLDEDLKALNLTSANSINIARWLPQLFYFLFAFKQVKSKGKELVFSVPSGNFGNICAGMVAHTLGMPVKHFVASVNSNDIVPEYLKTGEYKPKPSVATISNAMDVGDPSNFIRIQKLFNNDLEALSQKLSSFSYSDEETKAAMQKIYAETGYIADPHGAVGYLGLKHYLKDHPDAYGIFLETAHPVKFLPVVNPVIDAEIEIPEQIKAVMDKEKHAIAIKNYDEFKSFLLS